MCDTSFVYNIYTFYNSGVWYPAPGELAYSKQITGVCLSAQNVYIAWDAFGIIGNTFSVVAYNAAGSPTTLLSTGCVTGTGSTTQTIPAGTVTLVIQINSACNTTGGDQFTFLMQCV